MSQAPPVHPTPEELLAYPLGELSAARAHAVLNHCNRCEECGRELAMIIELRAEAVIADSLKVQEHPVDARAVGSWTWRWAAVAAGVALIAALLAASGIFEIGDDRSALSPYAELATHETLPEGYFDFRFGGAELTGTAEDTLREGLLELTRGRYDEAMAVLESYIVAHPADGEAKAYLGIARYLSGDTSPSTVELLAAGAEVADTAVSRNAAWYLANVELATGNLPAARIRLESLATSGARVARQARELLARLPQ